MEAQVTLKVTPREFDLVRASVECRQREQTTISNDRTTPAASRRFAREQAAELGLILERLR